MHTAQGDGKEVGLEPGCWDTKRKLSERNKSSRYAVLCITSCTDPAGATENEDRIAIVDRLEQMGSAHFMQDSNYAPEPQCIYVIHLNGGGRFIVCSRTREQL